MSILATPAASRTLYLVVCAAPPALAIGELVTAARGDGWDVWVLPTPTAATWIDTAALQSLTGHPVRSEPRLPQEKSWFPDARAVAVVPATFNTINKWAAGINDTLAVGILHEVLGSGIPVVTSPYVKAALSAHPAFARSLDTLRACGVRLTQNEALRPLEPDGPFNWQPVLEALR